MMTEASADLTCWLASVTRSLTDGRMDVMITCSRHSGDRLRQKSEQKQNDDTIVSCNFKLESYP